MFAVALGSVIVGLYGLRWQADHVGVVAAALAALAALALRVRGWSVVGVLEQAGRALLGLLAVTGVAGLVIGVLQYTGPGFRLALLLTQLAGGNLPLLLLLTAAVAMLLGMGMPTVAVYVLMATLVAPALVQLGVPALAAHLFVFYFGMLSMITPPVCLATFTAAAIGGCDFWRAGWAGMRLAAVSYIVPFLLALEQPSSAAATQPPSSWPPGPRSWGRGCWQPPWWATGFPTCPRRNACCWRPARSRCLPPRPAGWRLSRGPWR